jgi:anti-sigma factor RsiW
MTRYDDETLMRRVDGELTPQEGERVDAEALHDSHLAARLTRMRGLRTLARDAFAIAPD